jgi:hypothetical protein
MVVRVHQTTRVDDPAELALDPSVSQRERRAIAVVEDDSPAAAPLRDGVVYRARFLEPWASRHAVNCRRCHE